MENFVAAEVAGQQDTIRLTETVTSTDQIFGISDQAQGTFTLHSDGSVITFGPVPPNDRTFSDVLNLREPGTFNITMGDESGQIGNISVENFEVINFDVMVCFMRGTHIATPTGERRIETLKEGDVVTTLDDGPQKIQWIGSTTILAQAGHAPIRFEAGSIGNHRDLLLSPQHRILVKHPLAELYYGSSNVLVPAKAFVNGKTIKSQAPGLVTYFHILLETHQIIRAEGVLCETLLLGDCPSPLKLGH
jgi:hypothetical protein